MFQDNQDGKIRSLNFPGYQLEPDTWNEFVFIHDTMLQKRRAICIFPGCGQSPTLDESWACQEHSYWIKKGIGATGRKRVTQKTVHFQNDVPVFSPVNSEQPQQLAIADTTRRNADGNNAEPGPSKEISNVACDLASPLGTDLAVIPLRSASRKERSPTPELFDW